MANGYQFVNTIPPYNVLTKIAYVSGNNEYSIGMKEQRAHPRHETPSLIVSIDGQSYQAEDWSYGGFLLKATSDDLPLGTLVNIDGVGTDAKNASSLSIRARVVRVTDDGTQVALNCLHLDNNAYRVLAELDK